MAVVGLFWTPSESIGAVGTGQSFPLQFFLAFTTFIVASGGRASALRFIFIKSLKDRALIILFIS